MTTDKKAPTGISMIHLVLVAAFVAGTLDIGAA
jgi:hypothetical protein